MQPIFVHAHVLMWMAAGATLVLSVPWGLYVRQRFVDGDARVRAGLVVPQLMMLIAGIFILLTPWSFSGVVFDSLCLLGGYLAYNGLVFLPSLLPPRKLTWLITAAGLVPTTIGMLSFVGSTMVPRESVRQTEAWLTPNYSYRVAKPGGATIADDDAELSILYHPSILPFMEKEVFRKIYVRSQYNAAALELHLTDDRRKIVIACPRRDTTTVERTVFEAE